MRKRKGKKKLKGNIDDYPLVIITCSDWTSDASCVSISKAEKMEPAQCTSVGYLLRKTKNKIIIFSSWSEDEDGIEVAGVESIPKPWVKEIKHIRVK